MPEYMSYKGMGHEPYERLTAAQLVMLYGIFQRGESRLEKLIATGMVKHDQAIDLLMDMSKQTVDVYWALMAEVTEAEKGEDFIATTANIMGKPPAIKRLM